MTTNKDTDLREALRRKYADTPQMPADLSERLMKRLETTRDTPKRRYWPYITAAMAIAASILLILNGSLPWIAVATVAAIKWAWQIISFSQLSIRFNSNPVYLFAPLLEIYFTLANTILILTPLHSNRKFKK